MADAGAAAPISPSPSFSDLPTTSIRFLSDSPAYYLDDDSAFSFDIAANVPAPAAGISKPQPRRSSAVAMAYKKLKKEAPADAGRPRRRLPAWYLLAFGSIRVNPPPSASRRRSCPASPSTEKPNKRTWSLLRSLSCGGIDASAAVVGPF